MHSSLLHDVLIVPVKEDLVGILLAPWGKRSFIFAPLMILLLLLVIASRLINYLATTVLYYQLQYE
ncbi:MAG: hypothetical protein IT292_10740 [Deltaproteobacteria bacterium]|nr:hypothetical protein [Deltaproteobacteria bacterium]